METIKGEKPEWKEGDIAYVARGWIGAGTEYRVIGFPVWKRQWWIPVDDPTDDNPVFFKDSALSKEKLLRKPSNT